MIYQRSIPATITLGRARIQSEYLFTDARQARTRFTFANTSNTAVELRPGFYGCLRDKDQPTQLLDVFDGAKKAKRSLVLDAGPNQIESGLIPDPEKSDLPQVRFRIRSDGGSLHASAMPGPVWGGAHPDERVRYYLFQSVRALMLAAGGTLQLEFTIDYRAAAAGEALDAWPEAAGI